MISKHILTLKECTFAQMHIAVSLSKTRLFALMCVFVVVV